MTRTVVLASVLWAYLAASASAQSAEKIVDRHIDAVGGKRALEQIVSSTVTGTVTLPDGRSETFIQETKRPNRLHINMTWSSGRWSTGFNGRSVWQDDPRDGLRTLMGRAAAQVRAEAAYAAHGIFPAGGRRRLTLVGKDQVRGRPVFVVDVMTQDVLKRTLSFDANSYLLVKEQHDTEAGSVTRFFDDYRRVGQVMEPHRIEWHRGDESVAITVKQIAHNVAIDERVFDFPQPPTAPPISVVELLSSVMRNQQKLEEVLGSYAYTETRTWKQVDQTGRMTKETTFVFDIFYAGGHAVRKLVKRNDRDLSTEEQRREQKRVDALVRAYRQSPKTVIVTRDQTLTMGSTLSTYLRVWEFTNPRRERVRDTTAVVFDAQPKRDVRAANDLERQLLAMAGSFWIDERAQQIIRADVHATDAYSIRVLEDSWFASEQTLVNNEVWLPSYGESQRSATLPVKFIDKRFYSRESVQYSDYRKFNVESDYKITLPEVK
jgi:outer membrane lipoprotein-sorting protein